ncbi:hypothetical protein So717_41430 [Roseobacter cerasinus]|uniref:Uncharacterized protein n=1 Tax=Roseobacter cerasinus TaxID=2602289 RepID=A0A640VYC9_9RHOB|nr:AAA family ATPase [Roseobacter cerasinus]GFE52390.1 hypothetical protein So717_41430 [Roseobacter cerasinus]
MRIRSITIENFRAINSAHLVDLSDAVVIAGPNGCGKSSIFDAIRFLKSAYGQYEVNEFSSWFNEFQIDTNKLQSDAIRIFNDPNKPLKVAAEFQISKAEDRYLRENAFEIFRKLKWSDLIRGRSRSGDTHIRDPRTKQADSRIVEEQARELAKNLINCLDKEFHLAKLTMTPGDTPAVMGEPLLELVFSLYQPGLLGVIDYQSPSRIYGRENIQNLSLQIRESSQKRAAQSSLYNTQSKYTGIKTEMAQSYIKELLTEKAGIPISEQNTLQATLDELFSIFFPGKKFLGVLPTPEGGLEFPVELENGKTHDINELSSGEKEVLLGYLRLRNSAPKNSIILLDEPELHLNPRLARGLPRFYQKHLGEALGNQIWLVTHSDAILREAVQEPSYNVFHMQPPTSSDSTRNQVEVVDASAEVETAIISLVGDLAAYSPRSKILLLEGEDSDTDARIITELFPELAEKVNLISGGSKSNVQAAHRVLNQASLSGGIDARFYSIVDRDFDGAEIAPETNRYSWDVYHIENFLLHPRFILGALRGLSMGTAIASEAEVQEHMEEAAAETVDELARIKLERYINSRILGSVSYGYSPSIPVATGLASAVQRSFIKISEAVEQELTSEKINEQFLRIQRDLNASLADGRWLKEFRGRNIIRRLAGRYGYSYETLRNLIVSRMREEQFKPDNMKTVLQMVIDS